MEPLNCTVHTTPTSAEVWTGTQVMGRVQAAVAKAANLPESKVTVHNYLIGGGFGRRLEPDMAYSAARIAKCVQGPVKVVWTREEDMRHDVYRHNVLSACLKAGRIVGWKHKVSGSSVIARFYPERFTNDIDIDAVESAQDIAYDIANYRVEFSREEPPGVVTGFWRGVGPNNTVFAVESFMDEGCCDVTAKVTSGPQRRGHNAPAALCPTRSFVARHREPLAAAESCRGERDERRSDSRRFGVPAVLFATPEYNRSVPGVLKNAIDVGSRPYGASVWSGKPAAVLSVSPGSLGGFGANHHLRQYLVFLDMPVLQQPEAYLGRVASVMDDSGQIKAVEAIESLKRFVDAFERWIRRLRTVQE
jgi:hypothetical protein